MNNFWTGFVNKTAAQGKRIFKAKSSPKVSDYTIANILRSIRQEQLKNKISGRIRDAPGSPVNKAKIKAQPITGGRSKTVHSKSDGSYVLKSLPANTYNITVTAGNQSKVEQVTLATGDYLNADIVIE